MQIGRIHLPLLGDFANGQALVKTHPQQFDPLFRGSAQPLCVFGLSLCGLL